MLVRQELLDFLAKEGLTVVNVTHVFEGCQGGTSHTSSSIIIVSHMAKRIKKKMNHVPPSPSGAGWATHLLHLDRGQQRGFACLENQPIFQEVAQRLLQASRLRPGGALGTASISGFLYRSMCLGS